MTCGFEITFVNRYIDTDWLVVIGRKIDKPPAFPGQKTILRKSWIF